MILTNILQEKKYGVVQTDDRIFPKNNMSKVALVSQNVQNFKKIHQRKHEKIYC